MKKRTLFLIQFILGAVGSVIAWGSDLYFLSRALDQLWTAILNGDLIEVIMICLLLKALFILLVIIIIMGVMCFSCTIEIIQEIKKERKSNNEKQHIN